MSCLDRRFVKIKENEETSQSYWGCIHASLFVAGVLTFGFLDAFTAVLMMEKYGIGAEFNSLMRELVLTQGIAGFLLFKVAATASLLSVPFLLYKRGTMNCTKAGFLLVFSLGGTIAAMDNYILLRSGQVWVEPWIVAGMFLVMMVLALQIGEIMDSPKKLFKISDEGWERMKLEIGHPVVAATTKPLEVQPKSTERCKDCDGGRNFEQSVYQTSPLSMIGGTCGKSSEGERARS